MMYLPLVDCVGFLTVDSADGNTAEKSPAV